MKNINSEINQCPICDRELGTKETISQHHLLPKSKGGKNSEKILIHNICHQKIHSVFTENELRDYYNSVEKLKESEEIQKFIKWVSKKDINYYQTNKKMNRKK